MSSDERRCIDFFQTRTMPMLVSFFEWEVWRRLALQLSQAEPAVCHALVSLSAMHSNTEVGGLSRGQARRHRAQYHRFAIEQYGRAMSTLCRRLTSQDPHVAVIALVCCIVFTYLEVLQGNNENACTHLTNGIHILSGKKGEEARSIVRVKLQHYHRENRLPTLSPEMALLAAIMHLDIQLQVHRYVAKQRDAIQVRGDRQRLLRFQNLDEAWRELQPISGSCLGCLTITQEALQSPAADLFPIFIARHKLSLQLQDHIAAFNELAAQIPCPSAKEVPCMNLIRMQHIVLKTHVYREMELSEHVWEKFTPDFMAALQFGEATIESLEAEFGPKKPSDGPLKCRHLPTRQRGIQLLRRWPHWEGPHHTSTFVALVEGAVNLEEERRDPVTGVIPEEALVADVAVIKKEGCPPTLGYTLSHPGGPRLELPFPMSTE
ncbi:uncharacterized protein BP01DRAFT_391327 [Aspergillus saccharolyticus JOP 1030-1]|uniref:C6 zinc finger domain protein n=1 Tax=Aspergillus saccharolyticus JOP 1030-1 TaxID=1450539 RepID=A0A318ZEJ0_9EURO|nr:hypothetical protein BP01DRAFT_391327 [Aspergillus saccharolyticus JOP 1030-1]PYH45971.1 hypothetical protein BP01DRAFT_391327 [Aspergillus saccharolyticus JOP 1030-1]